LKKGLLYIVLICFSVSAYAQKNPAKIRIDTSTVVQKKFDENNLENYRNDTAFKYEVIDKGPSLYAQIAEWFTRLLRKIFSWFFEDVEAPVGFLMPILKILPYIIAAIVLYLIVNFFLKINVRTLSRKKRNREIVHITNEEALLNSKDLPKLIQLAIEEQNYRLAIRYQYVLLLQQLSNKEMIVWEQQKTNEDYIREVQPKNIQIAFEEITRFYDFVWYGNFEIGYEEYLKGIQRIQKIKHRIT
jgi:hypothetical protein